MRRSLANTNNHRECNTRDTRFYPVVRPSNTCLLLRCGVPMDDGCTQPLSSDPMINLNTTDFSFGVLSRLRGISTTWSLSPLQWRSQRKHRVRLEETTHTQHNSAAHTRTQAKTWAQNVAQRVHNSNGAQITNTIDKFAVAKCGSLGMLSKSLGCSSMRLEVSFTTLRQLGAIGGKLVEWRTGQSGAPPNMYCRRSGA
jgi:hypothetical protein